MSISRMPRTECQRTESRLIDFNNGVQNHCDIIRLVRLVLKAKKGHDYGCIIFMVRLGNFKSSLALTMILVF